MVLLTIHKALRKVPDTYELTTVITIRIICTEARVKTRVWERAPWGSAEAKGAEAQALGDTHTGAIEGWKRDGT